MRLLFSIIFLISLITISSCKQKADSEDLTGNLPEEQEMQVSDTSRFPSNNEYQMMAVLYTQTAAEYRALCYQAFRTAKYALELDLLKAETKYQRAVILDIDETVLDNSPYQAACVKQGISYPECWEEWCAQAVAEPVPGVMDFLDFAKKNHVEIFYITNRKDHLREVTIANLANLGIAPKNDEHLLMRIGGNSKEERRMKIRENYHVSVLIGDNLGDFSSYFEGLGVQGRNDMVDSLKTNFGTEFIMLPNAMYGDWVSSMYNYDYSINTEKKREIRFGFLNPANCPEEPEVVLGE